MVWTRLANPSADPRDAAAAAPPRRASGRLIAIPSASARGGEQDMRGEQRRHPRQRVGEGAHRCSSAQPLGLRARHRDQRLRRLAAAAGQQLGRASRRRRCVPRAITSTRSASSSASAMSCVTRIVVRPSRSCSARIAPPERCRASPDRARRTARPAAAAVAPGASARATPTRWRWPPDSSAGIRAGDARAAARPGRAVSAHARPPRAPRSAGRSRYSRRRSCAGTARRLEDIADPPPQRRARPRRHVAAVDQARGRHRARPAG